jgi:TPR repeat protein
MIQLFKIAAKLNHGEALHEVGRYHQSHRRMKHAMEYFYRGFLQEHGGCATALALIFLNGHGAVVRNPIKAVSLLRKALQWSDGRGAYELALYVTFRYYLMVRFISCACLAPSIFSCQIDGRGCEQNVIEGMQTLQRAIELGERQAIYHLAMCYFNGVGVPQDLRKVCFMP